MALDNTQINVSNTVREIDKDVTAIKATLVELSFDFLADLAVRHPHCRPVQFVDALRRHGFRGTSSVAQMVGVVRFLQAELPTISGDTPENENLGTFLARIDELQRTRHLSVSRAAMLAAVEFRNITPRIAGETPYGEQPRRDRGIIMQNVRNANIALLAIAREHAAARGDTKLAKACAAMARPVRNRRA